MGLGTVALKGPAVGSPSADEFQSADNSTQKTDGLIEDIKGQEEHHRRTTLAEGYCKLSEEAGIEFDERYVL